MKKFVIIILLPILFFSACQDSSPEPDNTPDLRPLSNVEAKIASSGNEFAFNIFRKVQQDEVENVFISPLSISLALGMTLNGAEGETRQSILNTIDFGDFSAEEVNEGCKELTALLLSMDNKIQLGIANSVWSNNQYTLKTSFREIVDTYYDGTVQNLDFGNPAAKETINHWVEDKTNDRIKNLIEDISPDEIMFLVNAIYFKGDWTYKFDNSKTHKADFTRENGSITQVDMMFSREVELSYYSSEEVTLIDIPYGNGQFNMTILLPLNRSISDFVGTLSADDLHHWLQEADTLITELEIPKFKMTWKLNIQNQLSEMGMLMSPFPHFFEEQLPLEISTVIHQSFIEVNEEGSEAAAATAIGIRLVSIDPPRITIDKPFVFLIREKHTGVVLFVGQLVDPDML